MRPLHRRYLAPPVSLAAAMLLCITAYPQDLPSKLVKSEWLAATYGKFEVRVIDMRPDIRDYWTSHLPGAVYLNPEALRWPENGMPVKLMPVSALTQLLGQMGITPATSIVLYSEKNGFMPLYLLWALEYIGHKNCALLDGGFDNWKAEGRFLTQDYPAKIRPVVYPVPQNLQAEVRASLSEVKQSLGPGFVLIDSRPFESYSGEKGTWKRRGHIPGSVSHFWNADLAADGSWRSKEDLRGDYAALGATPDKKIIVYCGSGQMSSHTYFVLKHILGYPWVKNFDGGFGEWSSDSQLPVDKSGK